MSQLKNEGVVASKKHQSLSLIIAAVMSYAKRRAIMRAVLPPWRMRARYELDMLAISRESKEEIRF